MLHPILQLLLEEWRLEELRAEESARRELAACVPRWRRMAGRAMVEAGRRLLREPAGSPPPIPAPCRG